MAVIRHSFTARPIPADLLARWRQVPPAIAGDCLNRDHCMTGRIAPLAPGMAITGPARTVTPMAGDNAAIHVAIALIEPGDVLVIGGGGDINIALIGGIIMECAKGRGIGGVVIDAAVRDVAELRALGVPVFAAGATPRGPHKGFGGEIDAPVACGDVVVTPGGLILADDDGGAVVPAARMVDLIDACEAKLADEAAAIERIRAGTTTVELQGLEIPVPI